MESKINEVLCDIKELAEIAVRCKEKDMLSLALIIEKIDELSELLGSNYEIYRLGGDE